MSITSDYTATHAAFRLGSVKHDTQAFVVRTLVALAESPGGRRDVQSLAELLACDGSAIRRALPAMARRGWATSAAEDGGRRRQGIVTVLSLTEAGRGVADEALTAQRGFLYLASQGARG